MSDRSSWASRTSRWRQFLTVLGLVIVCGCDGNQGPRRVSVAGTVSVDGQPLDAGTIRFLPAGDNRGPAASGLVTGGDYRLSGASGPMPGRYQVLIVRSVSSPGGKLSGATAAQPSRLDWQEEVTVPNQDSHQQDFKLTGNDSTGPSP